VLRDLKGIHWEESPCYLKLNCKGISPPWIPLGSLTTKAALTVSAAGVQHEPILRWVGEDWPLYSVLICNPTKRQVSIVTRIFLFRCWRKILVQPITSAGGTYCAKLERMTERVSSLSSNQSRDNIRRFPCRERNSKNSAGHGHPFCSTSKACWAKKRPASRPMHDADEGGPVGAWDLWSPSPSPSSCRVPITNYASSSCSRVKSVQVRLCQTKERGRPSLAPPSPFRCAEWQQWSAHSFSYRCVVLCSPNRSIRSTVCLCSSNPPRNPRARKEKDGGRKLLLLASRFASRYRRPTWPARNKSSSQSLSSTPLRIDPTLPLPLRQWVRLCYARPSGSDVSRSYRRSDRCGMTQHKWSQTARDLMVWSIETNFSLICQRIHSSTDLESRNRPTDQPSTVPA
jgi:hypothetical protein